MQKQLLANVSVIRPVLIVLLVFYHAFAIYSGGWDPIEGFPKIRTYFWLDKLSYAFMLEAFVFLSGYVFGYQVRTIGEEKLKLMNLVWSKFKRLIVPGMVFSFLYILLLKDINQPVGKTLYSVVNGVGHLWFLPMLFWCFIGIWLIEKLRLGPGIVIPLLLLCSLCSFVHLPLRLDNTMYYLLFFYSGFILKRREVDEERFYKLRYVVGLAVAFAILFPVLTLCRTQLKYFSALVGGGNSLIINDLGFALSNGAKLVYSSIGLALLFSLVGVAIKKRTSAVPQWLINIGNLCMGVYIFQQFILAGLYDHTTLPTLLGPYWLPWIGFIITLSGSLLISFVLRLTKVGRFLIG